MDAHSHFRPHSKHFILLFLGAALLVCCGCSSLLQFPAEGLTSRLPGFGKDTPQEDIAKTAAAEFNTSLETPMLGDYISVQGNTRVPLRGIGLVVNLDGTGGSPPPSAAQSTLRQEMARLNIPNPSRLLANPNTALVIVTAYLPPNVRRGQHFDVRIALPPNTNATSLKGGYLLATRLFEEAEIRGHGTRKGKEYAVAEGPVLTAFGASNPKDGARGLLSRGSIPGGAVSATERDLEIVLRKRFQSFRKSKQIADAVTGRFQLYDRFGRLEEQATAKTNALITLKSHPIYRNNFPRFHQVIRNIPFAETEVSRRLRMERLAEELLNPATSAVAAMQLEAIGNDAKPFLKAGLDSDRFDVRFFSAEALAYLQDSSGVEELKIAAREQPAFRVYAFAALSITRDANSIMALRELMSSDAIETRYGALRALSEIDSKDRALNTVHFDNRFTLRQVKSDARPAVHLTRRRIPEVAIFNTDQTLLLPAVLNVGHKIRVIGNDGDETVEISRYIVGEETIRRRCSCRLTDVIRMVGELGAAYPDIVQFMIEAEQQDNLAGELGIDRLPQAGRSYVPRSEQNGPASTSKKKLGTAARMPGIFDRLDDEPAQETEASLDLTTLTQPDSSSSDENTTESGEQPTSASTADSPSSPSRPSDSSSLTDDPNNEFREDGGNPEQSGGLRQFLRNPFAQHQF